MVKHRRAEKMKEKFSLLMDSSIVHLSLPQYERLESV